MGKEKSTKWLVSKESYFFDGHGTGDSGGIEYFITTDKVYSLVDHPKLQDRYFSELEYYNFDEDSDDEIVESLLEDGTWEADSLYEQDGYNCEVFVYSAVELTTDEANTVQGILTGYKNLSSLWTKKKGI